MRKSFFAAGLAIIPFMIVAGSFGLMAVAGGIQETPSTAFFQVVLTAPPWVIPVVLVLALALVMSSADTLINAISAVFTVDIARFYPSLTPRGLRTWARTCTALVCLVVIVVASRGYSVLYLFLIADLVCTGAAFPTFYGLYSSRLDGCTALGAALAGIAGGALLFPDPSSTRGNLFLSFLVALAIPACLTLIAGKVRHAAALDMDSLAEKIHDISGEPESNRCEKKTGRTKEEWI